MTSCKTVRGRRPNKRKTPELMEIKFGEDGDFFVYPSEHHQEFRVTFDDDYVRGIYHEYTQRSIIYLRAHEVIEDIISTCEHETIHHCLVGVLYGDHAKEGIEMDIYQEHWAIKQMAWAKESITKEFDYHRNQAVREEMEK